MRFNTGAPNELTIYKIRYMNKVVNDISHEKVCKKVGVDLKKCIHVCSEGYFKRDEIHGIAHHFSSHYVP